MKEKELNKLKNKEASDLGIQDFFSKRDKTKRGASGLIEDSSLALEKETEVKQELYDKSMKVNSLPEGVEPLFSNVFLTARRNKLVENGLFLPTASFGGGSETDMQQDFSDKQIVLAKGAHAQQVELGYEVVINMDNFKKRLESSMAQKVNREFEYVLPIEVIDGVEYLFVNERDIKYISKKN